MIETKSYANFSFHFSIFNNTKKAMNWKVKFFMHNGEHRLAVYFEKNTNLNARIKTIEGPRRSESKRVWHIPDTEKNREQFNLEPHPHDLPSVEGIAQIIKLKQWLLSKKYSVNTIKTYGDALKSFLVFYREKAISEITNNDVIA